MDLRSFGRRTFASGLAILVVAGSMLGGGSAVAQDEPIVKSAVLDGESVIVTHVQGETTVPLNPEVVVVFDLATADTLDALGVTITGVPKATLSGHLEHLAGDEFEDVGTLFEPDYEAVNALQPDLIVVAARSGPALPELSRIAPTIDLSETTDVISDLEANVNVLATIFDKEAEAEDILSDIHDRIATLQEVTADIGTGLVIMTSGGNLTAIAPGWARGGLIYQTLGVQPPVDDVDEATHGEAISFEFLLEHDPDWLFVIDRDIAIGETDSSAAEAVLDNDIIHQTTAWQEGQIVYLSPFPWYITMGGITSFQLMLDELEAAFIS